MAIRIVDVKLDPQNVVVGENVLISVLVGDNSWNGIKEDFVNWNDILYSFDDWNDIQSFLEKRKRNSNLFTGIYTGHANHPNYNIRKWTGAVVEIKPNTTYTVKRWSPSNRFQIMTGRLDNGVYARMTEVTNTVGNTGDAFDVDMELTITSGSNDEYLVIYLSNQGHFKDILLKVEEGNKATDWTPAP